MTSEQEFEEEDLVPWLTSVGWEVSDDLRDDKSKVIFSDVLEDSVHSINEDISKEDAQKAVSEFENLFRNNYSTLVDGNYDFYDYLKGKGANYRDSDGISRRVDFIDFEDFSNNDFRVVNQFEVVEDNHKKRLDIVLLVNGIPLVISELKKPGKEYGVENAVQDLCDYQDGLEKIFYPNVFLVGICRKYGNSLLYGCVGSSLENYSPWSSGKETESDEDIVKSLLSTERVLELLDDFIVFKDAHGGMDKMIARHNQYYATKEVLDDFINNGMSDKTRRRFVWHSQGSGKSLTMLFCADLIYSLEDINPQILIIVDETKLNQDMKRRLESVKNLNIPYDVANSIKDLKKKLNSGKKGIIVTTVQKFQGYKKPVDSDCDILTLEDEVHRNMSDKFGSNIEVSIKGADRYGFTGTPRSRTFREYGEAIHVYNMDEAVGDEVVEKVDIKKTDIIGNFDRKKIEEKENQLGEDMAGGINIGDLIKVDSIRKTIVEHIVKYYKENLKDKDEIDRTMKSMVVTSGRKEAALVSEDLKKQLGEDVVDVFYSEQNDKSADSSLSNHLPENQNRIISDFENQGEKPHIGVVCRKLLTGFDAPALKTIFLLRDFNEKHTLMQAISRVNRPHPDKEYGEIVDYFDTISDSDIGYDNSREFATIDKEEFLKSLETKLYDIRKLVGTKMNPEDFDTVIEGLKSLNEEEKREKFLDIAEEVNQLRNEIAPDRRLIERELDDKVTWVNKARDEIKEKHDYALNTVRQNLGEEALQIIDEELELKKIETSKRSKEFDGSSDIEIQEMNRKIEEVYNKESSYNPEYTSLVEELEEIIDRWDKGELDNDTMKKEQEEIMQKGREIMESEKDKDIQSIEGVLKNSEYEFNDREKIAEKIVEKFEDIKDGRKLDVVKDIKSLERKIKEEIDDIIFENKPQASGELEDEILKKIILNRKTFD